MHPPTIFFRSVAIFLLFLVLAPAALSAEAERDYPDAIDFPKDLPWLNVSRPLSLAELRGKVVILDFWTYGCINCIHVLKDLRRLSEKYGENLVVVGVHTPKFENEKNLETLRRIVVRYGIEHPVINDKTSMLARLYGMRAWPTQYLIDPEGKVLGKVEGEGNFEVLDDFIGDLLVKHRQQLNTKPLPIKLEKTRYDNQFLAAPGKIAVGADRVVISDTLHNRIVIADHSGKVEKIVGSGRADLVDGNAQEAAFNAPQGVVIGDGKIYVTDTGNHAVREIDLRSWRVKTIAGNGKMESHRQAIFDATSIGLRSPWALALKANKLYIAMAGSHQIWRLDLDKGKIRPWAGSGRESIDNGEIRRASFSQPSGLSLQGNALFVADAEVSAVRKIDLDKERVETLVGSGLFDFGDVDGDFDDAQLQHVLGIVAAGKDVVFIADTYNHKLKKLDLRQRKVATVAGTGKPGKGTGEALKAALNEPGGLAMLDGDVLIADTNNDRIVRYDPESQTLSEWTLQEE